MLNTSPSKRKYDTSMGNSTINAKEEIKTVALPETFSSFDTTRDTRQHQPVLTIPHLSDSQNELLSKFAGIADVPRAGKGIT